MKATVLRTHLTPYNFFHPVKVLGNISGTMTILGCTAMVGRRMSSAKTGKATVFDWTFLWVLFATVITGFGSQVFRVFDLAVAAYGIYYVHLVDLPPLDRSSFNVSVGTEPIREERHENNKTYPRADHHQNSRG